MVATTGVHTPAETFYGDVLDRLQESGVSFMVGGAYALREYADIVRDTKDLDVFCTAGDYPRLLQVLADAGCNTQVTDASWLAKAFQGEYFVDLIFNSANRLCPVDDSWFERAPLVKILGRKVKLVPVEDVLWSKCCVQDRERYDGADVQHIIRKRGRDLDWHYLLRRMEPIWEVLLQQLIAFRFVYPSERNVVPEWLMLDLLGRVESQLHIPESSDPICRGPLLSRHQYEVDVHEWGYEAR